MTRRSVESGDDEEDGLDEVLGAMEECMSAIAWRRRAQRSTGAGQGRCQLQAGRRIMIVALTLRHLISHGRQVGCTCISAYDERDKRQARDKQDKEAHRDA